MPSWKKVIVSGSAADLSSLTVGSITASAAITGSSIEMSGHITGSNGQFTGALTVTGDITAYHSSDRRLKDNIEVIEGSLEKISKIGGYTFDWNNNQAYHHGHDVGVIAQEIEEVLPEVVVTRENGYKAVRYEKLIALLIEANKELLKRVEKLEKDK